MGMSVSNFRINAGRTLDGSCADTKLHTKRLYMQDLNLAQATPSIHARVKHLEDYAFLA